MRLFCMRYTRPLLWALLPMCVGFRAGDDEGSMEFKIVDEEVHDVVTVNLLVSGMSYLFLSAI